jgi:hypothetical protein
MADLIKTGYWSQSLCLLDYCASVDQAERLDHHTGATLHLRLQGVEPNSTQSWPLRACSLQSPGLLLTACMFIISKSTLADSVAQLSSEVNHAGVADEVSGCSTWICPLSAATFACAPNHRV